MKTLAFVLLAELAFAAPLKRDGHAHSPYSTNLQRVKNHLSKRDWKNWGPASSGYDGNIIQNNQKYLLPVTVGGKSYNMEIDTGSSDTWLIQTGFQCYKTANQTTEVFIGPIDEDQCNFGDTYTPGSEFQPIDLSQLSCYGQGNEGTLRCVGGTYGLADIDINGLTIPQQTLGAPINSSFPPAGRPIMSGLLGLAFPDLTSAENSTGKTSYSSIIDTAFAATDIERKFSLALSRDESANDNGGVFTIGGIPKLDDPAINASSAYTSAPFQQIKGEYLFYSIVVDGFVIGENSVLPDFEIIVDSGANTVELDKTNADAVNALWNPPGQLDDSGNLILDCNAVLTDDFGVTIGGTTYYIQGQDLILLSDDGTQCSSAVSAGVEGEYLVGDPLLKNTLAVFDWEGQQLSFYERQYYQS